MKRYFRKHKNVAYGLLSLALAVIIAVELLLGWENVLIWTGLKPSPVTAEGVMEVHYIDVGNADSILIRQGDKAMLIDAGERGDNDDILDYFRKHGVSELDLVISTHPHADHVGAMSMILEKIPVKRFVMAYMPAEATPTSMVYEDMLEMLDQKNIPVDEAKPGTIYTLGDAEVQILAPFTETDDANDMSVVTRVVFGQNSFLFTGDAGKTVENQLMKSGYDIQADVLKVSHHGSNTANSLTFLKKVKPQYAVITCGADNLYGHPHDEVVSRLKKQKATIYRSDVYGDIVFYSDGENITIETEKGALKQ